MVSEAHARWRARSLRDIIARMRHDGYGGRVGKAELLTGIEGVSKPASAADCAAGLSGELALDGLRAPGAEAEPF